MLFKKYARFDEMYTKRRLITKIDRSKLRRSVPIMDYNIMAKGKKKLLRKRKHDVKINTTSDMKRRKFENNNVKKIKKMVLLASGKNISNAASTSTCTRSEDTKTSNYVQTSYKQFLHKQKYTNYININKKCPLVCSESVPDNQSVHTRSMTRQHSFIGSIYNRVLYNEELKINGQDTSRDSTELPLWPEGDKTISNVMLDSLNHVLQFCSSYQKFRSDKKEIAAMPVKSQNKIDEKYFASEGKHKQLHKLKVSDHKNVSEWKIDENGLEYKMIKISLPSICDKLNDDDGGGGVFIKPQDPSCYKALNKDYIKTVKKCKEKEENNIPDRFISQGISSLNYCNNNTKSSDNTIIVIDDDEDNDKESELNDFDVSQSLYNMIVNTSQLYSMLCGVPVTETTNYINNFRIVPF